MQNPFYVPLSRKSAFLFGIVVFCLIAPFAFAQKNQTSQPDKNDLLRVSLSASLVVTNTDEKGVVRETLQPLPDKVYPGDVIQYSITAINTSTGCPCTDMLKNIALIGTINKGTVYIEESVTLPPLAMFSIDGGVSYHPWPISYIVETADGSETVKTATAEQYTNIQWIIPPIGPQERLTVSYRVRVE